VVVVAVVAEAEVASIAVVDGSSPCVVVDGKCRHIRHGSLLEVVHDVVGVRGTIVQK